jgi:hypothetical protein
LELGGKELSTKEMLVVNHQAWQITLEAEAALAL